MSERNGSMSSLVWEMAPPDNKLTQAQSLPLGKTTTTASRLAVFVQHLAKDSGRCEETTGRCPPPPDGVVWTDSGGTGVE